jgi:hypothetical protein
LARVIIRLEHAVNKHQKSEKVNIRDSGSNSIPQSLHGADSRIQISSEYQDGRKNKKPRRLTGA